MEGAELAVLETVDFSRMTINAMVVETDGINATKDGQVVELLTNAGFVAAERGPNRARWTRNGQVRRPLSAPPAADPPTGRVGPVARGSG